MKNTLKKIIPILLIAVLFVSLFPILVSAEDEYFDEDPQIANLKWFADSVYSRAGYNYNDIYYINYKDKTTGIIEKRYFMTRTTNSNIIWELNTTFHLWNLHNDIEENLSGDMCKINEQLLLYAVPNCDENYNPTIQKVLTYEEWLVGNYPEIPINIEDIGLPERTMDYYIVWSDVINGESSRSVYYQEFNGKPIVAIYSEIEATSNIYDMSWEGTGVSKKYLYNETTSTWDLVTETLPSNAWEELRSIKKIYGTNLSLGVSGIIEDVGQMGNFGGSLDTEGFGIRFLLPRDGYVDNSFLFSYLVEYRIPWDDPSASPSDITLNFDGDGKADTMKVDSSTYDIVNEVLIGTVKMSIGQEYGQNIVRAFIGSQEAPLYQASVRTTRLEGFVDVNNDGLDDRIQREDANIEQPWDSSTYNPGGQPSSSEYGDDLLGRVQYGFDTLFYWLTSPFRLVADGFDAIITTMEESFGWATDFSIMITGLFSFLPGPVVSLLGLAFVTIIVVAVIKVVRG